MFQSIYIEESISSHPLTRRILERFSQLPHIPCSRYGEIFNRGSQDFRLQKKNPSLILAKKQGELLLPIPENYGIGTKHNYYFSHMLNCLFDCRYCFLQGMFKSANYVLFVNYEDFQKAIVQKIEEVKENITFFSGYDCDSLALEPITHFVESFLPVFASYPSCYLELRTKSTQIQSLLKTPPISNCIVAFSLSPKEIAEALEHKAPPLHRRLEAIQRLQEKGWPIGLRFDPLIYSEGYKQIYSSFFKEVFQKISLNDLHSITLGTFRLPRPIYKNIFTLYPDEKLFAHSLEERSSLVSYKKKIEEELVAFCQEEIVQYAPKEILFPCRA